jgi:hypothetical protein
MSGATGFLKNRFRMQRKKGIPADRWLIAVPATAPGFTGDPVPAGKIQN